MQAIEAITQTETAVSTEAASPAKRPWQTPICTKFTAEELTERIWDANGYGWFIQLGRVRRAHAA